MEKYLIYFLLTGFKFAVKNIILKESSIKKAIEHGCEHWTHIHSPRTGGDGVER